MNNSIKALAKEAKQRMRVSGAPDNKSTLPELWQEEERVYRVVCRMMQRNEVVTDPIMQVADPAVWPHLEGVEKERYVLRLSEVYLRAVERYRDAHAE